MGLAFSRVPRPTPKMAITLSLSERSPGFIGRRRIFGCSRRYPDRAFGGKAPSANLKELRRKLDEPTYGC